MDIPRRLLHVGAYVLGFFLPFNVYLLPWMSQTPRAVDGLGFVIACMFGGSLLLHRRVRIDSLLRVLGLLILIVPIFWHGFVSPIGGAKVYAIRWIIAVIWGATLWKIGTNDETRTVLFRSMLAGCIGCIGVIVLQSAGFMELTKQVGLAPQDSISDVSFLSVWRVPGMEKHVNGSAAIVSLAVPIAIGLIEEKRLGRKWMPAVLGLVALSAALTLNRSSILVTSVTLVAWVMLSKSDWISGRLRVTVVAAAVIGILVYGPPGGWQRWNDLANLADSDNARVRIQTTLEAARLTLLHPFGMGLTYSEVIAQNTMSRHGATHNALFQIALRGGWPIFLAILIKVGSAMVTLFRRSYVEGWLSLHLFGLFFFEEYLSNVTIVILVTYILLRTSHDAYSARKSSGTEASSRTGGETDRSTDGAVDR